MTPTDRPDFTKAESAETMERWTTSPLFPLTAAAVGVLAAFGLLAAEARPDTAAALGLGVFAALLALRNWWMAEEDRPLLAEELLGVHDAIDGLRAENADLRDLLTDLAAVVEETVADRGATMVSEVAELEAVFESRLKAMESRLAKRIAETPPTPSGDPATPAPDGAELGRVREMLRASELRGDKLTKALRIAVTELRRQSGRLDALEASGAARLTAAGARALPERAGGGSITPPRQERPRQETPPSRDLPPRQDPPSRQDQPSRRAEPSRHEEPPPRRPEPPVGRFDPRAQSEQHDVLMQAIVSLDDGEPRFLETFSRSDPEPASEFGRDEPSGRKSAGASLEVDNLLLSRAIATLDILRDSGRDHGVFCGVSMASLRSDSFLRSLLAYLDTKPGLAERLVFELNQVEVDRASTQDVAVLERIHGKGVPFALDHVVDWSVALDKLSGIGFRFVKLDCGALLHRVESGFSAAERLIEAFDKAGLELVVQKIETAGQLERIEAAGVRFGQGEALAPPRLIRLSEADAPRAKTPVFER